MKKKEYEKKEIQLSLSRKELIDAQNNNIFSSTVLRLLMIRKCLQISIL